MLLPRQTKSESNITTFEGRRTTFLRFELSNKVQSNVAPALQANDKRNVEIMEMILLISFCRHLSLKTIIIINFFRHYYRPAMNNYYFRFEVRNVMINQKYNTQLT